MGAEIHIDGTACRGMYAPAALLLVTHDALVGECINEDSFDLGRDRMCI